MEEKKSQSLATTTKGEKYKQRLQAKKNTKKKNFRITNTRENNRKKEKIVQTDDWDKKTDKTEIEATFDEYRKSPRGLHHPLTLARVAT